MHLARYSQSIDLFTCCTQLTWFMGGLVSLPRLSPRVALNADSGSLKKANDTVTVLGSSISKVVMNCASVYCSFCPKCTRPAAENGFNHCLQ